MREKGQLRESESMMFVDSDLMISHFHCLVGFVLNSGRCSKGFMMMMIASVAFFKVFEMAVIARRIRRERDAK